MSVPNRDFDETVLLPGGKPYPSFGRSANPNAFLTDQIGYPPDEHEELKEEIRNVYAARYLDS